MRLSDLSGVHLGVYTVDSVTPAALPDAALHRLSSLGIVPGAKLTVLRANRRFAIVQAEGVRYALGAPIAAALSVHPLQCGR